jgi:hypothetical protein
MKRKAIGIDPDSQKIVCVMVDSSDPQFKRNRTFFLTDQGVKDFITWVKKEDAMISLEGLNGQSRPIEDALRKNNIVFYSFKPSDVASFRKVVLGSNKNNKRDAESVARFTIALDSQGKLDNYKRFWFPDAGLQNLTRECQRLSKKITVEISSLWKAIKAVSSDLYLFLGGSHPDSEMKSNILNQKGILNLLSSIPNVSEWKKLSTEDLLSSMGGQRYKNREKVITELKKIVSNVNDVSLADTLVIKNIVNRLLLDKTQKQDVEKMIKQITVENESVKTLLGLKGIGVVTASIIVAETVDIRRFVNDDRYASYSGFGMNQKSTGDESKLQRLVHTRKFNHRLKNAYMSAAKTIVFHNPELHIAGYFRSLRKKGLSIIEARKRVARALVRDFYKLLKAINPIEVLEILDIEQNSRKSMASDQDRSGIPTISNMPLSA